MALVGPPQEPTGLPQSLPRTPARTFDRANREKTNLNQVVARSVLSRRRLVLVVVPSSFELVELRPGTPTRNDMPVSTLVSVALASEE
jgi:hypothetical protein